MTNKEPSIAVSVDMLDTGVDVPEVVNLVSSNLCLFTPSQIQPNDRAKYSPLPNFFFGMSDKQSFWC